MRYQRKQKIIIIVALVIAIVGMSLGFAAFTSTLNISSSATITPNSSDFKVLFSTTQFAVDTNNTSCKIGNGEGYNGAVGGIGCVKSNSISDMAVVFTKPNQSVDFRIYIHNTGEYDAYLKSINIANVPGESTYKKCEAATTDSTAASSNLVQEVCDWIGVVYDYNGVAYSFGDSFSNMKLAKGEVAYIDIYVTYNGDKRVDGPMNITFGDISLEYSTVDGSNLMSFTIDGTTYSAERGMTWQEWYDSSYNTSPVYIENDYICSNDLSNQIIGSLSAVIIEGKNYPTGGGASCK